MIIVNVFANVKPDMIEQFKQATLKNAANSIKEPGVARFDFLQQEDNPVNFLLVEVYKDNNAIAKHKETLHYAEWRSTVESMMAQPRKSIKYSNIFPDDTKW